MAQENWQKYKLLKLLELLRQETDEQNPLSTSQICNKLGDMGIVTFYMWRLYRGIETT